jgi:tRNA(fMet)-specific endonuclease VapC
MPGDLCLSSIVLHELYYGACRSARPDSNVARLEAWRSVLLPFGADDAREAGRIRAHLAGLAGLGTPIGPYDVLIAGQARARSLTLVTRNTREFARVPDLRVENWETP